MWEMSSLFTRCEAVWLRHILLWCIYNVLYCVIHCVIPPTKRIAAFEAGSFLPLPWTGASEREAMALSASCTSRGRSLLWREWVDSAKQICCMCTGHTHCNIELSPNAVSFECMYAWVLMMLRGGTAPFQIETGRWKGIPREERMLDHRSMVRFRFISITSALRVAQYCNSYFQQ